jgi:hypothetical protein
MSALCQKQTHALQQRSAVIGFSTARQVTGAATKAPTPKPQPL